MTVYTPGASVAVVAEGTWLLIGAAPGSDVVRRCWELVRGGAGLDDVLNVIVHGGFRAVGSFALIRYTEAERRVVLRGDAVVGLVGLDGVLLELRADGVTTWVDTGLPDSAVELRLTSGTGGSAELPLERGVVLASRLVARLVEAPEVGRVTEVVPAPGLTSVTEVLPMPAPVFGAASAVPQVGGSQVGVPQAAAAAGLPQGFTPSVPGFVPVPVPDASVPEPVVEPPVLRSLEAPATPPPDVPQLITPQPSGPHPVPPQSVVPQAVLPQAAAQTGTPQTVVLQPNSLPPNTLPPNTLPPNTLPPNGLPPNGAQANGVPEPQAVAGPPLRVDETMVRRSGSPDDTRHVFTSGAPKVRAVACPLRHLNPEHAIACRVCGQSFPPQDAFVVPRPPLGVLRLSTGELITLDRNVVLGRDPQVTDRSPAAPHAIRLANQGNDISRNHVEVRLDGWDVLVVDLGSKNGTTVIAPGWSPQELAGLIPAILAPGSRVMLGEGAFFTYEVTG